jgi:putative FmdB family regulatory protein
MPLYEYFCNTCEYFFEELLKKDIPNRRCPNCGKAAHRIISKTNFKVNGYSYANGYSKGQIKTHDDKR